jgi:hypothetical protein
MMEQAKNDIFAADSTSVLMADSSRKDFFFFFLKAHLAANKS